MATEFRMPDNSHVSKIRFPSDGNYTGGFSRKSAFFQVNGLPPSLEAAYEAHARALAEECGGLSDAIIVRPRMSERMSARTALRRFRKETEARRKITGRRRPEPRLTRPHPPYTSRSSRNRRTLPAAREALLRASTIRPKAPAGLTTGCTEQARGATSKPTPKQAIYKPTAAGFISICRITSQGLGQSGEILSAGLVLLTGVMHPCSRARKYARRASPCSHMLTSPQVTKLKIVVTKVGVFGSSWLTT
jgi:hypothetical protein